MKDGTQREKRVIGQLHRPFAPAVGRDNFFLVAPCLSDPGKVPRHGRQFRIFYWAAGTFLVGPLRRSVPTILGPPPWGRDAAKRPPSPRRQARRCLALRGMMDRCIQRARAMEGLLETRQNTQ